MESEALRLFFAVDPPEELKKKLDELSSELRKRVEGHSRLRISWVKAENQHLTLKFLGAVDGKLYSNLLPSLDMSLREITSRFSPFELQCEGTGAFPNISSARVLWIGFTGEEGALRKMSELATDLEKAMAPLGFPPEGREFSPHLTLGRVKEGRRAGDILAGSEKVRLGTFPVKEIILYRSILQPTGSVYEPLRRWALSESNSESAAVAS